MSTRSRTKVGNRTRKHRGTGEVQRERLQRIETERIDPGQEGGGRKSKVSSRGRSRTGFQLN